MSRVRRERLLFGLAAFAVLPELAGVIYQQIATSLDRERHRPPGRIVEVDHHETHLRCTGTGSLTIVLESALGENSYEWSLVQPRVAKETRVCADDRAGLGWSEYASGSRRSRRVAETLHALLEKAGLRIRQVLAESATRDRVQEDQE